MRLTSIEFSFDPCNICRDCLRSVPRGGLQNVQKCAKMATFVFYGLNYWETVEDRWVHAARLWQALNSLSIHVTFTAIVPGAYPGESKMWLKTLIRSRVLLKTSHSPPIYRYISETVEERWVHAARRLTTLEFSFDPCNIYRDCPRGVGYPADARSVGDSHPSCYITVVLKHVNCLYIY